MPDAICATFKLHYRCYNCTRKVFKRLDSPDVEGAPRDVDELMESSLLQRQRYRCDECESAIGVLIAVTLWEDEEVLA